MELILLETLVSVKIFDWNLKNDDCLVQMQCTIIWLSTDTFSKTFLVDVHIKCGECGMDDHERLDLQGLLTLSSDLIRSPWM